jgi:Zn-dependent protease with chaperone function|tara:strand:- start:142 stop:1668 length:1527 start_codon:yes stop_codon:yes gene_type:complete
MRKTLLFLLTITFIYCQDEIVFIDGKILKGEVDKKSIVENPASIRFKPKGWQIFSFYHVDQINFVRSWNGKLLYPKGVVANVESKFYHLPNVKHLPSGEFQNPFSDYKEAKSAGFLPCKACFLTHPQISDYALEKELVKATIIQIQNTNEIMYEHPLLPKLQSMMNNILRNWSEKLKGYDYRIQIIRDDSPNAFAVAGGNLYFSTGLLEMSENDEELESVLAHEIAHVERRHTLRAYKEYLKKQQALAVATTLLAVAAVAAESEEGLMLAGAVSEIGKFAIEYSQKGYDRDLEQEADMFAQIYLNNSDKELTYMLSSLDKLATHSKTRLGYVPQTNAFSSHPNILSRVKQIENSEFFDYDSPLSMEFHPIKTDLNIQTGFIKLEINHAYKTISSDSDKNDEILLLGKIINEHSDLSFQINSIKLNFLGSLGVIELGGIVDVTASHESSTEFVGRIKSTNEMSEKVLESVKNKKILPFAVDISAVVLQSGKNSKKVKGLQNIQCTMIVN